MKTSKLTDVALDWAVAKCEGFEFEDDTYILVLKEDGRCNYSTNWAQGGPIIEREKLEIVPICPGTWRAISLGGEWFNGSTPLIAAMRCYVASKLGDEVGIPEELR